MRARVLERHHIQVGNRCACIKACVHATLPQQPSYAALLLACRIGSMQRGRKLLRPAQRRLSDGMRLLRRAPKHVSQLSHKHPSGFWPATLRQCK